VSFLPVLKYGFGLGVFGFIYWLLDGILTLFIQESVHTTGTTFNILHALWTGGLLVYLVFGGWWLIRTYNEKQYQRGF
jgi:hypothetical protein